MHEVGGQGGGGRDGQSAEPRPSIGDPGRPAGARAARTRTRPRPRHSAPPFQRPRTCAPKTTKRCAVQCGEPGRRRPVRGRGSTSRDESPTTAMMASGAHGTCSRDDGPFSDGTCWHANGTGTGRNREIAGAKLSRFSASNDTHIGHAHWQSWRVTAVHRNPQRLHQSCRDLPIHFATVATTTTTTTNNYLPTYLLLLL